MTDAVRVVIADDSPFVCRLLTSYLEQTSEFEVVGTAANGDRAVELVRELRPEVVTLDLDMPDTDGLAALEQIMHEFPTPVVLISGVSRRAADITLKAIDIGAVDFVLKYAPGAGTDPDSLRQEIVAKVRAASQVRVVRSVRPRKAADGRSATGMLSSRPAEVRAADVATVLDRPGRAEPVPYLPGGVIVIGASTGGPVALRELLGNLPSDFPAAIIIIQHMPANFTGVLAAQLDRQLAINVKEAADGDRLEKGLALVAPGDRHLLLRADARVELSQGPPVGGHRPSIDVTMQSVAQVCGSRTTGVVLTGMGNDGTGGLASIRSKGGATFAQDKESSIVSGMPDRAVEAGVVDYISPPPEIAYLLTAGLPVD